MIFGKTWEQREQKYNRKQLRKKKRYFLLLPHRVENGQLAWLTKAYRRKYNNTASRVTFWAYSISGDFSNWKNQKYYSED